MKEFDIVVHGATGVTGHLVIEYFLKQSSGLRWAMGGRSASKLAAVRDEVGQRQQRIRPRDWPAEALQPARMVAKPLPHQRQHLLRQGLWREPARRHQSPFAGLGRVPP